MKAFSTLVPCIFVFSLVFVVLAQPVTPGNEGTDANALLQVVQPDGAAATARERMECGSEFRTINGVCTNNLLKLWASTGRAQGSLSRYSSSLNPTGTKLPSARHISNVLSRQAADVFNDRNLNELLVFFGQFIDHTMVITPAGETKMPIPIPTDDPIFANFSGGQLGFKRSQRVRVDLHGLIGVSAGKTSPLQLNIERPVNSLTSVLDLSSVYGSELKRSRALRTFSGGKLKTSAGNLLPRNDMGLTNAPLPTSAYFVAGDTRSNEHPVLTSLHTLWLREHNDLCEELSSKFPSWDDDLLYNMSRKISGAEFQKIVLEEFYPAIVGKSLPPYRGFNGLTNPVMLDVFTTAAFRVGHTMVGNKVNRRGPGNSIMSPLTMESMFFRLASKLTGGIEQFLRGAMQTKAQEIDVQVHNALRNFLFTGIPEEDVFFDLIALNIQRGRDHAIPKFNEIRKSLGIPLAAGFSGITKKANVQSALQTAYGTVDKVEAWIGLVAEDHVSGSSLGRTMIAVWEKQFKALRDGDRFYYRNNMFDEELKDKIPRVKALFSKTSTFKSVVTRNTDIVNAEIPSRIFF
ncbi:Animal heme peroxidase homologue [Chondrus crispus]|uniref:Animal heme peroxidase homologue n=1 Tax=Chondrus crispus TaxID=2769 RepID=S0F3X6_CHOCR|nr:Animal heme peroxidase homologue [Chondrus crispus]CDF77598.1 Animal heme peroxidase homologue [Chondrus crispus]|eukprot:XP_005718462.1 Animal heme peroxidase homologue [Chondrus crispus]